MAAVTPCLSEESNGGAMAMPLMRSTSTNNNNGSSNGRHRIVGDGMIASDRIASTLLRIVSIKTRSSEMHFTWA